MHAARQLMLMLMRLPGLGQFSLDRLLFWHTVFLFVTVNSHFMKTTGIIVIASAALTGLAIIMWNRIMSRQSREQLSHGEPMQRSRHVNPVFSRMKQHVQENI